MSTFAPGRPRLADIAAQAGVSTATVSRVLNGKSVVAGETRQAVMAALDVLGYERPQVTGARSAGLVGLVVPELSNPVFPAIAQAAESLLAQAGYTPLLCTQSPGGTTEDEYIETLGAHGVNGILFVSGLHADTTASRERYRKLRERGVPIVLIGGFAPEVDAPQVSTDERAASHLAVRHLVAQGHRAIGLALGPERFVPSRRKRAGFLEALVLAGLAADEEAAAAHVVSSLYTVEGGTAAANELLDAGHTALVCASDVMALGAVRAARSRGLRIPEDVSVVGYDDSPLMAFTDPPLTTVRQPVQSLCRTAVQMLLSEIRGERATRSEIVVEPELVVRRSTGAASLPAPTPTEVHR
ncbi:transcriptional regulator, LacI family [Xylanimonas cellulosilytica DSM 15894]|uniref:Transcriptional regulator, LacI family n=1 Tax=Xylanimonas cellulosilytica (strain DSM 15894 / JCM 12276 / CECT 5975 / KCTC 9989 / LMG 20990 / NBRC 107835 / XIL07) TaxID=446471 RepID=D1BUG8_XYLCX|nr:LacI family DNA-binding transcriptional regulator [Xylanimonas cellulosilytica]ACZ31181.1 transcriptional regulator, LacI family [Xylanimonas cellulosilytica DSM 15894]